MLDRWTQSVGDVDFLFDMYSRWAVQRFLGAVPRLMQDRSEAVAHAARLADFDHPVHGLWAITDRTTGKRFGVLLLQDLPASSSEAPPPPSGETEIGWHLHPDAWGNGYGSDAASRVLRHAFDSGLSRVLAVTKAENTASQRLARRIGMHYRGTTDRFYNATCELFEAHPSPSH